MEIINLVKVTSTHTYLKELIKQKGYSSALCVTAQQQTDGIGSRGNSWQSKEGNLFFSFVLKKADLPKDLFLQSASIYFSYIFKEVLNDKGSKLWLKWPNDFYIDNKKIGGTITSVINDLIYCGIGLNLIKVNEDYGSLDIKIDKTEILQRYFKSLEKDISWKQIFSQFKIEFQESKKFEATLDNRKISLEEAILNDDGSIEIDNVKVFSLR